MKRQVLSKLSIFSIPFFLSSCWVDYKKGHEQDPKLCYKKEICFHDITYTFFGGGWSSDPMVGDNNNPLVFELDKIVAYAVREGEAYIFEKICDRNEYVPLPIYYSERRILPIYSVVGYTWEEMICIHEITLGEIFYKSEVTK
ncbi:MAG: hypothetical protein K6E11_00025 [Bacilli bacterium]|nr:hypothetical protein [Bacilli bacterium]